MKAIKLLAVIYLCILSTSIYSQDKTKEVEKYFTVFLNKNGNDLYEVFLQHQPQLNDCRALFKKEYYQQMYQDLNAGFVGLSKQIDIQNNRFKNKTACRARPFKTDDVINGTCTECPGIMKRMEMEKKLKPGIVCYTIQFLDTSNSEYGSSYSFFTFINGHWIYIPTN